MDKTTIFDIHLRLLPSSVPVGYFNLAELSLALSLIISTLPIPTPIQDSSHIA